MKIILCICMMMMPSCVYVASNSSTGPISITVGGQQGTNTGAGSNSVSGTQNPVVTVPVSPTGGG